MQVSAFLSLARPAQWVKNCFVWLPLFFGGRLLDVHALAATGVAFAAFCLASSAVYCLNDVVDAEADRRHPEKCRRPVASGRVSAAQALALGAFLALTAMGLCLLTGCRIGEFALTGDRALLMWIIGPYLVLNVAYCLWLKRIALIDVSVIAVGFVLRLYAGSAAGDVVLSRWIISMTFLLALFLALGKRRDDVLRYEATGRKMRENISSYNLTFLNQALTLLSGVILVAYFMYTVSEEGVAQIGRNYLFFTSIFVLLGLLRYLQIAIVQEKSGSPTRVVFRDRFIQCCLLCWVVSYGLIIYL